MAKLLIFSLQRRGWEKWWITCQNPFFPPVLTWSESVTSPMLYRKQIGKEQAAQKVKHYCSYQERCHQEVKEKLYSFGLYKQQVEELLSQMIEEDYLNEERFAIQFAGGKFRMKQWGRIKIAYELRQKKVSEYCIKKAIKQIDMEDYQQTLEKIAGKKWASVKTDSSNKYTRLAKTTDYLLQKGFEPELIRQTLARLTEK